MNYLHRVVAWIAVPVLLLAASYVTSYYLLLQIDDVSHSSGWTSYHPMYRFGGEAAEAFYAPMHELDKMLRPWKWDTVVVG